MVPRADRAVDRRPTRRRARKSSRNRLTLYTMLATVAMLGGVIWVGSYLSIQPRVEALPPTMPFSREEWMRFIPDSVQFVAYVDYRAAFEATGNYTLFGQSPLLEVYSPPFSIYPASVEYELAMNLAGQGAREDSPTVSIVKADLIQLNALDDALRSSTRVKTMTHGHHTIYSLLIRRKELQTELVSTSLAISGGHLVLAQGADSIGHVSTALDTFDYGQGQLFSQSSARAALYAAGGSSHDYLALFVATFPTQIEGAKIAMKTVSAESGTVLSRIAFLFDTSDQARAQYENVKKLYTGGADYWILEDFVVATFRNDVSKLGDQIRGL